MTDKSNQTNGVDNEQSQTADNSDSQRSLSQDEASRIFGTLLSKKTVVSDFDEDLTQEIEIDSHDYDNGPRRKVTQIELDTCYNIIESIQGYTKKSDSSKFDKQIADAILIERSLKNVIQIKKPILGLHISKTSVKIASVNQRNEINCLDVTTIVRSPNNHDSDQDTIDAIKLLLKRNSIQTKQVVISHAYDNTKNENS